MSVLCFFHTFFFHTFPDIITLQNYRFHVFLRNCPPRRDLTVGYASLYFIKNAHVLGLTVGCTSLYFVENAHVLDLTVGYTSSLFDRHLEAFWGAADLSIV